MRRRSDGALVGGLYGVGIGGLFAGRVDVPPRAERDASKVAVVALVELLGADGVPDRLLDVQWCTPHLATLGVVEVPRAEYLRRLEAALGRPAPRGLGSAAEPDPVADRTGSCALGSVRRASTGTAPTYAWPRIWAPRRDVGRRRRVVGDHLDLAAVGQAGRGHPAGQLEHRHRAAQPDRVDHEGCRRQVRAVPSDSGPRGRRRCSQTLRVQ